MRNILRADFYRMFSKKPFWIAAASMLAAAFALCVMQHTAMDYTVPLSRVIFLPMTFYALALAALIGVFVGTDFDDGTIRNKIIAGVSRRSIYFSNLIICLAAALALYLLTTLFALIIGVNWFEADVSPAKILSFALLGAFTCAAYSSIFCTISLLIGNKARAIAVSMALAFVILFLCLETNSLVVQEEYKNGVLNPHYVGGFMRRVVIYLHDINPNGQAAQLSAMKILNPARFVSLDVLWSAVSALFGANIFVRKDII